MTQLYGLGNAIVDVEVNVEDSLNIAKPAERTNDLWTIRSAPSPLRLKDRRCTVEAVVLPPIQFLVYVSAQHQLHLQSRRRCEWALLHRGNGCCRHYFELKLLERRRLCQFRSVLSDDK